MERSIPTWRLVLACAEELTIRGKVPFTRKQLIECIQLRDPNRKPGTINPVIQGMTANLRGGPPGRGRGSLRSVGRGQFALAASGAEILAADMKEPSPQSPMRTQSVTLDGYPKGEIVDLDFRRLCALQPELEPDGSIKIFQPQSRYVNRAGISMHRYGAGPFCRFRIPGNLAVAGVYAIIRAETVLYVGECENLSRRFNFGYGLISPRNCFQGGQETNCRINSLVLHEAQAGHILLLYFHPCVDYKELEIRLRREICPEWNRI